MPSETTILSRSYPIGRRLRVNFSVPKIERGGMACLVAEWHPATPDVLSASELRAYRAARNRFTAEVLETVDPGGRALVIEV